MRRIAALLLVMLALLQIAADAQVSFSVVVSLSLESLFSIFSFS
jgi:hypothetical protein